MKSTIGVLGVFAGQAMLLGRYADGVERRATLSAQPPRESVREEAGGA